MTMIVQSFAIYSNFEFKKKKFKKLPHLVFFIKYCTWGVQLELDEMKSNELKRDENREPGCCVTNSESCLTAPLNFCKSVNRVYDQF